MSIRLPAPYPGLGHGGESATATRGPRSHRHHSTSLGESQGGLKPAERSHASNMSYVCPGLSSGMDTRFSLTLDANVCFHRTLRWCSTVTPLHCCPNGSEVPCCEFRPIQNFFALEVVALIAARFLSCLARWCLRAPSRNLDLVGDHFVLGEHFDPATQKEIALWCGGDEEGQGHAEPCLWNWGLTDPLQGPTCRAWRNIELHSLRYMKQKDEAEQS